MTVDMTLSYTPGEKPLLQDCQSQGWPAVTLPGPLIAASLNAPQGVSLDSAGNIYIADTANNVVRKLDATTGILANFAGNGTQGYSGDGGLATDAELSFPYEAVSDSMGNVYIADSMNNVIRKVDASGVISTVAGNEFRGYSGNGGAATGAELSGPSSIALDLSGNLYIADNGNNVIRKVDTSGIISNVAGNATSGYSGDGGPATSATLYGPTWVAVDTTGNLYVADTYNNVIREIDVAGNISTIAGTLYGYSGDNGPAAEAELANPMGVAVDGDGNVYIADSGNSVIRKVDTTGMITTIIGNGVQGYLGDGVPATTAELDGPGSIALDDAGNIFIADTYNNVIREVLSSLGTISSLVGAAP